MSSGPFKPDVGYAWVILVSSFITNVILSSVFTSAAVLMVLWTDDFQASKAQVGLVGATFGAVASFTGLFAGAMIDKLGCRLVSFVGVSVAAAGFILSSFTTSVWWLLVTYGIIAGIGHGLYMIPPANIVQYYFDKKRPAAAGFALTGHTIGPMIMLPVLTMLADEYGWRGAMLIHAGIIMQIYVTASTFKTPDIPELNKDRLLRTPPEKTKFEHPKAVINLNGYGNACVTKGSNSHQVIHIHSKNCINGKNIANGNSNKSNANSKSTCCQVDETVSSKSENECLGFVKSMWDYKMLTDVVFVQFIVAIVFGVFGQDVMYKFVPLKATNAGVDIMRASLLPSIVGVSSTCGSVLMSLVATCACVNRTINLGLAIVLEGVVTMLSCLAWDYMSLAVMMAAYGFVFGGHVALGTTVVVDLVGVGSLAQAHAFICGFVAIANIGSLSTIGLISDVTGNYDLPNYIFGMVTVACGVLVTTIPLTQRHLARKHLQPSIEETPGYSVHKSRIKTLSMSDERIFVSMQSLASLKLGGKA